MSGQGRASRHARRRLIALARVAVHAAVLALGCATLAGRAAAQGSTENDVKAAFLYNFTKFIEWPSLPPGSEPFRICVIGDPDLARALDGILEGESMQGHRLARTEPQTAQDARGCGILYVGASDVDSGLRLAEPLRQSPVLLVGNGTRFLSQGGGIAFVIEGNRVRFDINTAATDKAGLKVSSRLLRVARSVAGGERAR